MERAFDSSEQFRSRPGSGPALAVRRGMHDVATVLATTGQLRAELDEGRVESYPRQRTDVAGDALLERAPAHAGDERSARQLSYPQRTTATHTFGCQ